MPVEVFAAGASLLGEGASWDVETRTLWWVDILGCKLHRRALDGSSQSWDQPTEIGASVPLAGGGRALILRDRVDLFDPATGRSQPFWQGNEPPTNRFNDAGLDPFGNLWIGSMDFDATAETGALWRLTPDGDARRLLTGYKVVNGPVFSPDGMTLYFADTMAGKVLACAHDPLDGSLSTPKDFVDLGPIAGLADGMAMDAEGCLWLARITAGRVTRYSSAGQALETLAFPVPMVTSCAFGGADMSTLFVTSGRILMDDADLDAYPGSGSVYSYQTGTRGIASQKFHAGRT